MKFKVKYYQSIPTGLVCEDNKGVRQIIDPFICCCITTEEGKSLEGKEIFVYDDCHKYRNCLIPEPSQFKIL